MSMKRKNPNNQKLYDCFYTGIHISEIAADQSRKAMGEKTRMAGSSYPVSVKCTCYIDGFKRVLELVESIRKKEMTKDGKSPVITKGILKDIIRYVEFINNMMNEADSRVTEFLSNLVNKRDLSTEDMSTLSNIVNESIILLEGIMEKEEKEKEGRII